MKRYKCLLLMIAIMMSACGEDETDEKPLRATIMPMQEGAALGFRGYVTDEENELVGQIYEFKRVFSHTDTMDGRRVYAFTSDGDRTFFRIDEDGTVEQLMIVDLSERVWAYELTSERPVKFAYWETMFKNDEGKGTQWQTRVDTTVTMIDRENQPVQVRFYYLAKAQFDGWWQTAIPESQTMEEVLDVNVLEIENFIVNETSNDTLFVKRGNGHHYFDPELGMIKFVTDYHLKSRGRPYVERHGTWELVGKDLPQ